MYEKWKSRAFSIQNPHKVRTYFFYAAGRRNGEEQCRTSTNWAKLMCDIGKRIYDRNMVAANDGNISVKLNDNEFLCTLNRNVSVAL